MPEIAGDQLKVGDGKFVTTVILPLFCPQVVVVGVALAFGNILGAMVAVAVAVQPPPVTVTVYVPGVRPVGFCGLPGIAGDQLKVGDVRFVVTVILPLF